MQPDRRILCVDDEPAVLEGIKLTARRHFEVVTASSGAEGLAILQTDPTIAVVVSDMRMPNMNGAQFLARSREIAPDATRLLLTGQADLESAIAAVNDGQLFRFLTKPSPPPLLMAALEAAYEQHRLVTSEKVLLEQTLVGSIKALTEILSLTNPVAFGRAQRLQRMVGELACQIEGAASWQVDVAAMLSQLGTIALPSETVKKLHFGQPLTPEEKKMTARLPAVVEQLLGHIPRLEGVRAILAVFAQGGRRELPPGDDEITRQIVLGAGMLRIATDFDELETSGLSATLAMETLRSRHDRYLPQVVKAMAILRWGQSLRAELLELPPEAVAVGMVIADDVKLLNGTILAARGYEVTPSFVERLRNFQGMVDEPVKIYPRGKTSALVTNTA